LEIPFCLDKKGPEKESSPEKIRKEKEDDKFSRLYKAPREAQFPFRTIPC